jgi:hypothetical protein
VLICCQYLDLNFSRLEQFVCIKSQDKYGHSGREQMRKKGFEIMRSGQNSFRALIVAALFCINLTVPNAVSAADEIRTIELGKKNEVSVKPGSIVRLKFRINVEAPFRTSVTNIKTLNNTESSCEDLSSVKLEYMDQNFQRYWTFKDAKCTGMGWNDSPNNNLKGRFLGFHSIYIKSGSKDKTETYQVYVHQDLAPQVFSVGEKGVDLSVSELGCFRSDCYEKTLEVQVTKGHNYTFKFISEISPSDLWLTAYMNPPFGNSDNCDKYTCLVNNGLDWDYSPTVSGKFFIVLSGVTQTGPISIQTLRVVVLDKNSTSTLFPTPKATSPSPSPTKTSSALLRVPAGVTLDVTTTDSDVHIGAVTTVTYNGDIYDLASKPSGFNFYQINAANRVPELVASVAVSDAKCIKKSATKYSCTFPTFNPYSATKPAAGVPLTVSATNAIGPGAVSSPIGLYAYMVQPIGQNWNLTKWDEVSKAIYGTGFKNWLGFRSRESKSPIEATFILKGTWPKNPEYVVKFVERRANGTGGNIITANYSELRVKSTGQNHVVTVPSKAAVIRGDSVYIASIEVKDGTGVAVRGRHSLSFSLDYKMSLGCSSALLVLQSVRDTSKATLSTISWALTTTVLIVNDTLNKSGITKLGPAKTIELEKKLATLTGYAAFADLGVDLINAEAALSSGDKTLIRTTVTGIITNRVKGAVAQTIDRKAGTTVLEWELDRQAAVDLLGFLQTQGKVNGEFITDNCS